MATKNGCVEGGEKKHHYEEPLIGVERKRKGS